MPGQVVNISNNEAISEVALKCGDPFFRDFPKNVYSQAVFRAERGIAKDFGMMDRVWTNTNTAGTSPIEIVPLNFNGAWRVTVTPSDGTETEYIAKQVDDVLDYDSSVISDKYYAIMYNANEHMLYYVQPAENDVITIYYVSSIAGEEDYEILDSEGNSVIQPVLPNKYFEEVLRRGVRYIAQLGVAQFIGDKLAKYTRILQMYTTRQDTVKDPDLERERPWIMIKPFQYP